MAIDTDLAIVSLSDLKSYLQITSSDKDTLLGDLMNSASHLANRLTGRFFRDKDYTEYYDGDGTRELILKNAPINSITSIHDDVNRDFNSDSQIDVSADVLQETESGIVRLWNNESAFVKGTANIKVVYNAGYTQALMPHDIRFAVNEMVGEWYFRLSKDNAFGVQSKTNGARSITYLERDIPPRAKKILDSWRFGSTPHRVF